MPTQMNAVNTVLLYFLRLHFNIISTSVNSNQLMHFSVFIKNILKVLIFVVPCIMLNSEMIPTRCDNCVYSSQWLYYTCRVKPLRRINAIVASCWNYFNIKSLSKILVTPTCFGSHRDPSSGGHH